MRTARAVLATVSILSPILLVASPALAAAPSNDMLSGATPISTGSNTVLDTTEATTDADDVEANASCGAPATDASVWYSFTPAVDGGVVVDVSSSSYSAGVLVTTGGPGSLARVTCGPGAVTFNATAGTTYNILAFDDQFDGGGNGGTLNLSLEPVPPPPTVAVSVTSGRVDRTGATTLTGTLTCTDAEFVIIFGDLSQTVGRFTTIRGQFSFGPGSTCDGTPQPWTALVVPQSGKFAGGKAAAVTFTFACGDSQCATSFNRQVVQLRGGGNK